MCHTGGEAFKRRLIHSVALMIIEFIPLLKSFIANVPKCKAHLKTKFKSECTTKRSLVMSPFCMSLYENGKA